ncbi:Hydrogenase large subunit OS=Streptomyces violarus OX=67380 GN=FHS41_005238 PE=4 SV=1 [Streptomyces violarus]
MTTTEARPTERKPPELVDMSWDPITRIIGNLGIYTKIDFANREVVECHSTSSLFRGYSVFMKGKDPRDAGFITSRICGICGDNHTTCSDYAQQMAYGVKPPPLADYIVNLGEAAEYMFDHTIFQDNLVFVDFCEAMVKATNPGVLARAERTEAPRGDIHGYRTIAGIMKAFNPFEGEVYKEALKVSRITREMFCLMEGRHVHPSTLYPGGVGTMPQPNTFTDYLSRLMKVIDFVKKAVAMNDDVFDFFYEALPGYEEVGRRRVLLGCWGAFQDPKTVDYRYEMINPGQGDERHPGHHRRRRTGHQQPRRHQPRPADHARQLVLRGLGQRGPLRHPRPARQSRRHAPPVEPDHRPGAAEA